MDIHKQEFKVRDLPTRSVTLFPTRAQVVRDLKEVTLLPGANQISVVGFSPTVDESSIKVEGTGSAIISDMVVELLPNSDFFEEIYPSDDDDDLASDSDDLSQPEYDAFEDPPELAAAKTRIQQLNDDRERAQELVNSAADRLKYLDAYGKMLDRKRNLDIREGIGRYRDERQHVFSDHMDGQTRMRAVDRELDRLRQDMTKMLRAKDKREAKILRQRGREQTKRAKVVAAKLRRKEEKRREKQHVRRERERFWPRECYTVRITLDAPSFTPSTSRRSSFAGVDMPKDARDDGAAKNQGSAADAGELAVDLAISYVTSDAGWSPTYDLQLSTTAGTGQLCFDASLTNTTSESWSNCKVVLSTSQTAFSGLNVTIPILVPWRVKLVRGTSLGTDSLYRSREEEEHNREWKVQQGATQLRLGRPRDAMFGLADSDRLFMARQGRGRNGGQMQYQVQSMGFGASNNNNNNEFMTRHRTAAALMARAPADTAAHGEEYSSHFVSDSHHAGCHDDDGSDDDDDDGNTILPSRDALEFQESAFEETGLTSAYDLPGLKTLVPSGTASKQRVARISFGQVVFSHTVVAKYKPAAYLKAKIKNTSKITILAGPAGLTIDGSFMGRTRLPRCSPGDMFPLSLGVDPAIRVAYPKPDVKRATTGLFTKEDSNGYKRVIVISNTRAAGGPPSSENKPVSLLVLDQVPVSEDEKLRVDIQQPRGLAAGGGPVATGTGTLNAANSTGPGSGAAAAKDWGTATAVLKKAGEIVWDVRLNAGRTVKLALEYDVGVPSGESVTQC